MLVLDLEPYADRPGTKIQNSTMKNFKFIYHRNIRMQKKALIIAGKLIQDHEYIYPYYRLQEEGYEVDVAVRGKETVLASIGVKVVPTKDIPELKVEDYDVLVLPGGAKAMEYMRQEQDILKFISDFHASGKVIGSICHAGQLLRRVSE